MEKFEWEASDSVPKKYVMRIISGGLFDTVSSFKSMQLVKLLPLENWFVKLKAIGKAKKVVQLASADEHRYHFSLHNIDSAGGKGEQYFLPGTHSDIGGGYLDEGSDANLIVFQGTPQEAEQDRKEYLVGQGWFKKEQLVEKVLRYHENDYGGQLLPAYVELRVVKEKANTRVVRNAYCKIPLKLMGEAAGKSGITVKPKLARSATDIISAFPELTKLETAITRYIGDVGPHGSEAEHWQEPKHWKKYVPDLNAIRHQHLHFSARYNTFFGHNPRRGFFSSQRKRYVFNG